MFRPEVNIFLKICLFIAVFTSSSKHEASTTNASGAEDRSSGANQGPVTMPLEFNESLICGGEEVRLQHKLIMQQNQQSRPYDYKFWYNDSGEYHCFFDLPDHADVVSQRDYFSLPAKFYIDGARAHCAKYGAYLPQVTTEALFRAIVRASINTIRVREAFARIPLGIRNWTWNDDNTSKIVTWENGQVTEYPGGRLNFTDEKTGEMQSRPWHDFSSGSASFTYFEIHEISQSWFTSKVSSDVINLLVLCHQNLTELLSVGNSTDFTSTRAADTTSAAIVTKGMTSANPTETSTKDDKTSITDPDIGQQPTSMANDFPSIDSIMLVMIMALVII